MTSLRSLVLSVLVLGAAPAGAADLGAVYTVDTKALKAAVAGTPLTFALYGDPGCTALEQSVVVNVDDVSVLISKLTLLSPKGAPKPPGTAELRHTLASVAPGTHYLKVTGSGIAPSGPACQVQTGVAGSTAGGVGLVVKDANGAVVGTVAGVDAVSSPSVTLVGRRSGSLTAGVLVSATAISANNVLFFESFDCTGPPLAGPGGVLPLGTIVTGVLYYPSGAPVSALIGSQLISEDMASCTGLGSVFTPPDRCCDRTSFPGMFVHADVTEDLSALTPPFHAEAP